MKFLQIAVGLLITIAMPARPDSAVVFNEIMYHPVTNETQLEWVELQNQLAVDVDMSQWRLDGGIDYRFPEGTVIRAGGYLVIASSPAALMSATGLTNVLGPFGNRLSNAGERLRLRNNDSRIIDQVTYGVEGDWPVAPDGTGPSLARRRANVAGADARNWLASAQIGGTPGTENFPITPPVVRSNTVARVEDQWRFNDTGVDPGLAWKDSNYDDSGWPEGIGLFFQEDGLLPATKNTPLTPGRITYYFRRRLVITGDVERIVLNVRPVVDDGAVAYVNGLEVFRINMPAGEVNHSTIANAVVGDATFGETLYIASDHFVAGTNVLAVEVHQGRSFGAYSQAVIDANPLGYWRFGETIGPAVDSAGLAGAQNGSYAGFALANRSQAGPRPTDTINGQPLLGFETNNAAPRFAGNSDNGDDVVIIPDPGLFNFAGSRIFTLEAWVNGGTLQEGSAGVIAKGTGGGGEQFAVDVFNGAYRFFGWNGAGGAAVATAAIGPNGTWQHLVAVLDQPAGRMKLYINGVESASTTPFATLVDTGHEVSIGSRKNSSSSSYDLNFEGRIDEVAIYNRALSPAEITAHFNAAFTNNAAAGPDTNDVVFGLEIISAETLPEPEQPKIAFNEHSSSTNAAFWLELINYGRTNVDLGGWSIARVGGATNRQFTLPSQVLAPGELLQVTKDQMGFGADSGDRLVLYQPGGTNVADAFVAKKEPRGRSPDGAGAWWFPDQPTPGASNSFAFRDELVINEIMFHQRELLAEPATFSPTNLLLTISNAWKYHAEGVDLGTDWRARFFNDSAWAVSNAVFFAPTNPFSLPAPKNTFVPLTNSAGARIITYYFRTEFNFAGVTNGLTLALRPIIDDGAVFYLNGEEIYRQNMPATNILYGTLASASIGIPGFTAPIAIPITNLFEGLNTLAVEVHQSSVINNDFDFGTELLAYYQVAPALPFRDSPESWVEILNRSSNTVDLTGWRLDEGIDYRFPAGKTLAAGGYLVIARDIGHMQALYPGIDALGPFTNRLSHDSDYIVLKSPDNNIADEVRYFSGGRWHGYADGGGSSLELRDPRSDNMQPEAWAASNETGKAPWQTFTWRGLAAPGQTGEPGLWHELAFCLLDGAGEVLLDDVSVIETPSGTPRQLIVNGDLNGGAAHWRFLGNHRHSRVEPEPGNPGNAILHLVANGSGEYQGNQIETTLLGNATIVDGREYEISFRARWLAGKRKLNTRLYFNRLARTFDLPAPLRTGTPGAINSQFIANAGPTYSEFAHTPVVPYPNLPVTVSLLARDPDGIASLALNYSVDGGDWQTSLMSRSAPERPDEFIGKIPGQLAASIVQFYVEGTDQFGATSVFPAGGTNSRALYVVQDKQAGPPPQQNFRMIMTRDDATYMHTGTNTLSNELLGCTVVSNEREVFYDAAARLKGSFVGRNAARVGFHVNFDPTQLFRSAHRVVSVDRSQHSEIGGVGEIVTKHIANHAGGIQSMYDDLAKCIAPLSSYSSQCQLRLTGFDNDYLDAQFDQGSDGPMFEVEVPRWELATVDGNPESPKQVGNETGGTGYINLELQSYADNKENYRWMFLQSNRRTPDDYTRIIAMSKAFGQSSSVLNTQAVQLIDVDQWLRVMAYQELVGVADSYFSGVNVHNFRLYVRPEDQRVLFLPWDWDSAYLNSVNAPIIGTGNIAKLLDLQNYRRAYLNHMFDIMTTTFNTTYMGRWTTHYGSVGGQNASGILNYISARASAVIAQLPTTTPFAITSSGGNNFATSNSIVTIGGNAPIRVKTIEVNGIAYPVTWTSSTAWTLTVPLYGGANLLVVQGVDNYSNRLTNAFDTITVTNNGPSALRPVLINEWMADNAAPLGFPDPADGLFQDWLELFNPNTNAVNLTGFYLTDNLSQPTKWQIPNVPAAIIPPLGFRLVWADNEPEQNAGNASGDLHAGFQLNSNGEEIGLFSPAGVVQHAVAFGAQTENVSEGFFPDGYTNSVHSMTNWTPRFPNTLDGPLSFTTISFENGVVILTWGAIAGRAYRVEFKGELSAESWTRLGDEVPASSATASITDSPAPASPRFYRVRRVD